MSLVELWFGNSSGLPLADNSGFGPPAGVADETIAITNLTSQVVQQYALSTSYDAQYVFMRVTDNGGNPGGAEFRFTDTDAGSSVPEPSTLVLAALGLLSLGMTRRRRRR